MSAPAATCLAQTSQLPAQARPAGAPVAVAGFRSERASARAHVATCTEPHCIPGSKVTYILYPPNPKPDFERFKTLRAQLDRSMEQRLAPGSRLGFEPPSQTHDETATIFEARRTETAMSGAGRTVITRQVYTRRMAIELISSAPDGKVAEANLALFQAPLLQASQIGKER